jgi:hypothetical protein
MAVIAMTREIGSYGLDVAARLSPALGLKIIQSDIVANSIAERLGVDEGAVRRYVTAGPRCWRDCRSTEGSYFTTRPRKFCVSPSRATS